jgi:hypothetical protein
MVNEHMHGFYDTPKLEVAIHVSAGMAGAFLYGIAGVSWLSAPFAGYCAS